MRRRQSARFASASACAAFASALPSVQPSTMSATPSPNAARTLLVSGCDKLHNARAVVQDLEDPACGVAVFERFTAGRDGTLAYYEALARIFAARDVPVARVFEAVVARMHALAGAGERVPLR